MSFLGGTPVTGPRFLPAGTPVLGGTPVPGGGTPVWGPVPARSGWRTPLLRDRTTERALATWWAVCLLRSRRRPVLFRLLFWAAP